MVVQLTEVLPPLRAAMVMLFRVSETDSKQTEKALPFTVIIAGTAVDDGERAGAARKQPTVILTTDKKVP